MTPITPLDLDLLYFLCSASHHRCRVVRVKGPRAASLERLREARFVGADSFEPFAPVIADWLRLRSVIVKPAIETPVPWDSKAPAERPAPKAVDEGGGVAPLAAPSPSRAGPPSMAERARRFEEQRPAKTNKPHPVRPAAAAEAPRHRAHEREAGHGAVTLAGQPRLIAKRDPTQPPPGYQSRPGAVDLTEATIRTAQARGSPKRKQILKEAAARNADGKSNGEKGISVHVRMAQRALAEQDADATRLLDPIEQAKTLIRRVKGCAVHGAEVSGGPAGKFYVGRKLVSEAELLAMAGRVGA